MVNNIERGPKENEPQAPEVPIYESEIRTPEQIVEGKHKLELAEQQDKTQSQEEIDELKRQLEINNLREKMVGQEKRIKDVERPGWDNINGEQAYEITQEKYQAVKERVEKQKQEQRNPFRKIADKIGKFFRGE